MRTTVTIALFGTACLLLAGCPNDVDTSPIDDGVGDALYGEDCDENDDCAEGLLCAGDGACRYPGEPGTAGAGDDCAGNDFCQLGLVCGHDGTCVEPGGEGSSGVGEDCEDDEDCQLMLGCIEGSCHGFQVPLWWGHECSDPDDDTGPFRVHFEVPGDDPPAEFYRLPFPNDARLIDGAIDLSGHASPGALIPELGDVVGGVIDVIEADHTAFGNNASVFLRFSGDVNYDTLLLGDPGKGTAYTIDITPGVTDYGERHPGGFRASGDRGLYICDNWIAMTPSEGRPFAPGHTYASVITTGVLGRDSNDPAAQDEDFAAVLADDPPADDRLQRAWEAYDPFRAWLVISGTDPASIAGAAVFTVQDPRQPLVDLREVVRGEAPPEVDGVVLCVSGDAGPYADDEDETRGCTDVDPAFHEIQGQVGLPMFQEGTPPYKTEGGALTGAPTGTEPVVFSLTVPADEPMPATGWPLVIYGHGTGGNYRSHVLGGVAGMLSSLQTEDGTELGFAVLGIDAVAHGPRRHPDTWDPAMLAVDPAAYDADVLFFNVLNPRAARDNPLQAAADGFGLVQLAETLDWDELASPTGEPIRFDSGQLYYLGHSQGSTTGVGFVAYEPELRGAVFSGAGGLLIESMINKRNPYDLPAALMVGLADPAIDRWHPVLNLVQLLAERADAINHAGAVMDEPVGDQLPHHVLQTYGIGDTFTPDVTQYALARALRVEQVTNGNPSLESIGIANPPVTGNEHAAGETVTAVVALYQPATGEDGHYVIFDLADAQTQVGQFLATAVVDGVPTVVAP
jgi:hypothetical protein